MFLTLVCVKLPMFGYFLKQRAVRWALPVGNILTNDTFAVLPLILLFFGQPLDKLTTVPEALTLHKVEFISNIPYTVLLTITPWATIGLGAELPNIGTLPVSFIIFKLTAVLA